MDNDTRNRRGGWAGRFVRGLLIFVAGGLLGANVLYYLMGRSEPDCPAVPAPAPERGAASSSKSSTPAAPAATVPAAPGAPTTATPVPSPDGALVIPVSGVRPDQLIDTYTQSRGGGRVHDAIDIMAAAGTPVVAATDGRVVKLFASEAGGITLYQFDPAEQYVYYYAHLQGYAPNIVEGRTLRRGEVLGYVGATGNADPSAPHLHFAIARLAADKKWHGGTPVNPYPLLSGKPAVAATPPAAVPPPKP